MWYIIEKILTLSVRFSQGFLVSQPFARSFFYFFYKRCYRELAFFSYHFLPCSRFESISLFLFHHCHHLLNESVLQLASVPVHLFRQCVLVHFGFFIFIVFGIPSCLRATVSNLPLTTWWVQMLYQCQSQILTDFKHFISLYAFHINLSSLHRDAHPSKLDDSLLKSPHTTKFKF